MKKLYILTLCSCIGPVAYSYAAGENGGLITWFCGALGRVPNHVQVVRNSVQPMNSDQRKQFYADTRNCCLAATLCGTGLCCCTLQTTGQCALVVGVGSEIFMRCGRSPQPQKMS